ncbi:MAG: glycoside hydrolase family 97 protein [Prolixibacteraceae bacterium]|nr:glycoside hydrolase family 97 protein [Prolixibacteraceae bacterium]
MERKIVITIIISISFFLMAHAQVVTVSSPNKKIDVELYKNQDTTQQSWFLCVKYLTNGQHYAVIPQIGLGLICEGQDFSHDLEFIKSGKLKKIQDNYSALLGKKSRCTNEASEVVVSFENPSKLRMNVVLRAYNDGVAFRYGLPQKNGRHVVTDELTSYRIPDSTTRWLEKFDLSNEKLYAKMEDAAIQQDWCYPALFNDRNSKCWYHIHEAGLSRSYCATKLSNRDEKNSYNVTLPYPHEGEGEALPTIDLPWESPWRVVVMGSLADIVESTLVDDVSDPNILADTGWIKPGLASWNYWSDNHGTRDFQTVCAFTDLAAAMNWPYTLFDWEWDAMTNGGDVEDAAKYALSKGVKPLIWYNSGMFKWITATPVDRMKTHENRMEEFAWLKQNGFAGIKVDFFLSEKQYMINYYLDILEDAAKYELMVYFHGCLVPRGWQRTYPLLMTYEGVRGAEWYNNTSELTTTAPEHNTTLPFTRNVVGSMDYTPVTFTNSQHPHITSYGHELALSVVFESGIQHMADRPGGYYNLPDAAKWFLKKVPAAWDDTKLLDGFPGKLAIMARRKGNDWFLGGIHAGRKDKIQKIKFDFLPDAESYKLTLITDGAHDKAFEIKYMVVDKATAIDVKMLRRGGFVAYLTKLSF